MRPMCLFVGIDPGREPSPDESSICKFHHRLEDYDPGEQVRSILR